MADHTPAPWLAGPVYSQDGRPGGHTGISGGPDGLYLGILWTGRSSHPTPMADVKLVCAAPRMLAELRRLEWRPQHGDFRICVSCGNIHPEDGGSGHRPDCTLAAALAAAQCPPNAGA